MLDTKKALIVDDEEALREIIAEVLSLMDITSYQANNGMEAIEIVSKHKDEIGLLLIDMYMPNMSGEETYRQIEKFLPESLAIFMSGFENDQSFADTPMSTRQRFLKKPFTITQLKDMVLELIDES
ncbi:MAG: response regulator [Calditrichaceae bacterium]